MCVIDLHQHMGTWPFPGCAEGIALNLGLMARRGIDVAIVSSVRALVQDIQLGNAVLAEEIQAHPQIYGYVVVNPTMPERSLAELTRWAGNSRFVGAKIHTVYSGCGMGDVRLVPMVAALQEWGRPLLIHTWGASDVAHLRRLALQFPRLPIVAAHAGAEAWRDGVDAARECPNLTLDFAASTPYQGRLAHALAALGPERIAFGTDATLFDPLVMRSVFDRTPMSSHARELVMGGNAARLFGIGR